MIDVALYRQNESLAKKEMSKWQISSRHNLDAFEKAGFPVRVENNQQLRSLIDSMNENGFERYQNDMFGFSEIEFNNFVDACALSVRFSMNLFPNEKPILPIHNLAQAFLFFTLINKLSKYDSLLEIGPGPGALAYFIVQKQDLKLYAQTEACESFYIMQSHINRFLFCESFYESVFLENNVKTANFWAVSSPDSFQPPLELDLKDCPKKAAHYPWWKLGELASNDIKFGIIASNANLLEFSRPALLDYLPLIQKKLKDDGFFVFHCEGSHVNGNHDTLFEDLYKNKFAPLFLNYGAQYEGKLNFKERRIAIAPAGNFATKCLLQNDYFTSRFDEIVLVDDYKRGGVMEGRKIVSREELKHMNILESIVYHNNEDIINNFTEYFNSIGVKVLDIKPIRTRSFSVLIGERHALFDKYYSRGNFKTYFNSKEDCVKELFNFEDKNGKFYSKEEIIVAVINKL